MNDDFKFIIASPFDREKLICEIYYRDEIFTELSQETNEFMLEIYPSQTNQWWTIPLTSTSSDIRKSKKTSER